MPKMSGSITVDVKTGGKCSFKAVRYSEFFKPNEFMFECQMPGCHGCGCPTFFVTSDTFPEDIWSWLEDHAHMCSGITYTTAQSPNPDPECSPETSGKP